jgi:1,2-beta-oligoglucan phosphorylase
MTKLISKAGLSFQMGANGSLRRIDHEGLLLNLFVGNELEGGPTNLYLRRHADAIRSIPLLGPQSPTRFCPDNDAGEFFGVGEWEDIHYRISLVLAQSEATWFWHVSLTNVGSQSQRVDLIYAQDLGLAQYWGVRLNEFYVSQYLDHTPLQHPDLGVVVASRQNQAADGKYPWSVIGSLREGKAFATDALQFHGLATRDGHAPAALVTELPNRRLQHEHSLVVVQDAPLHLEPNVEIAAGFYGAFLPDHPDTSSNADLARVADVIALPEAQPNAFDGEVAPPAATLFSTESLLLVDDLDRKAVKSLFGSKLRHEERDEHGELLSFFHGEEAHVVLRAKELRVLRPHGHILRTGRHQVPDEAALTSTVWMAGVFHSMLTQGHVSINRYLSTTHSYLGLFRSHGLRVFVEQEGAWRLLNVPSAFEMSPDQCRWIYRHEHGEIQVCAEVRNEPQSLLLAIDLTEGAASRFFVSQHVALNGDDGSVPGPVRWTRDDAGIRVTAAPGGDVAARFPEGAFRITAGATTELEQVGGDELLFLDGCSREQPYLCIVTRAARSATFTLQGELVAEAGENVLRLPSDQQLLPTVTSSAKGARALAQLTEILPWFAHDAFVHYLSPRGLEQYSGGGWGTRDVCQGPVELLLALGRPAPIRDLLLRVFRQQNPDGDWPQWFMFFERERGIRPGDSHGDIVFWPLVALAQYLDAAGDAAILDEPVRFFDPDDAEAGEQASLWLHVQRALELIGKRVIPGTRLATYGHGDWNDSLQPADPEFREKLCSAWTVTLHFQTLKSLAAALQGIGRAQDAAPLAAAAQAVLADFQRLLLIDGVLAGYAHFESKKRVRYLLHPRDKSTGVRYSALAMIHAILEDLFTPAQAKAHLRLIKTKLSGPDGVRLFDRPLPYHGGQQRFFQRAETATYFGREIGLMYMHAHLRYAQALAHVGDAEGFFAALRRVNPIGLRALVPMSTLRQSNCYYSSSDAAFEDRYQASAGYSALRQGKIALDGGWRVYSSGAGIATGLIIRRFFGLDVLADCLRLDPVIPVKLDGLRIAATLFEREVEVRYRIGAAGSGVRHVELNGVTLEFAREPNVHRVGAARVPVRTVLEQIKSRGNLLAVTLG